MRFRILSCILVAATAAWLGCSDDSAPPDDVTAACTQLATSLCAKDACGGPFAAYPDAATCQSLHTTDCVTAAKRPGTLYTASAMTACAQALDAASCFDQGAVTEGSGCAFIYTGTLAEGAPCQRFDQCASGSCSALVNQCGVCRAVATEGQSCASTPCAPHLTCDNALCVRFRTRGEACTTAGSGARCDFPFACVSGTCQDANAALGAKCNFEFDTCDTSQGLLCNTVTDADSGVINPDVGTCQPYAIAAPGASCNAGGTACGPGITCVTSSTTCIVDPVEGAACGSNGAACLYPLACVNGTCTKPVANACP